MALRKDIIEILEENIGSFISGEEMARRFSVSRSAVAKCIKRLKEDGYEIESVNRAGHRLLSLPDMLSCREIYEMVGNEPSIIIYESIDSTNTRAKQLISNGVINNAIIAATEQTNGRGRQGKSFFSPKSTGLYFSCVFRLDALLADSVAITAASAVAVCRVIEQETKKHPMIKWVNDIFIDDKKVCGILTEAVTDFESGRVQSVVIGIGVNLTTEIFPEEIKDIASSVGKIDKNRFIAEVYHSLKKYCENLSDRSFMEEYRSRSLVLGNSLTFSRNGIDYTAVAKSILDDGGLEVVTDSGDRMVLQSGEISIKPIF